MLHPPARTTRVHARDVVLIRPVRHESLDVAGLQAPSNAASTSSTDPPLTVARILALGMVWLQRDCINSAAFSGSALDPR